MLFSTISSLLRGIFLIDAGWAELHAPLVARMVMGEEVNLFTAEKLHDDTSLYQIAANGYSVRPGRMPSAPEGSVAVLDISGPLIRYSEECGVRGMEDIANTVRAVNANPNFIAGVLRMNCPGGEASGTSMLADIIASSEKPWLTCVDDGMAASGGMWLASSTKEIYATNAQSSFGSIGAYCAFADYTKHFEKKGIKIHEVYSTLSADKNKEYRDARAGEYSGMEQHLDELVGHFIANVKAGRGERLNTGAGDPFTGKMFNAKDAQAIGLIDGLKSLDQVIARASELATNPKKSSQKPKTTMAKSTENKYPALASTAGWTNGYESTTEGLHVTHDEAAKIEAALAKGVTDTAAVTTQATAAEASAAKIAELEGQVSTLKTSEASWKTKAEAAGKLPANTGTTIGSAGDDGNDALPTKEVHEFTAAAMKMAAMNKKK